MRAGLRAISTAILFALAGAGSVHGQDGSIQWRFTVANSHGVFLSAPALTPDGSTVYIGATEGTSLGRLLAITREGGRKWVFERPGYIDSSPAIGPDGTVYIGFGNGELYALNPGAQSATVKWERKLGTFLTSSPAIGSGGVLYVGVDNSLHAVSPENGGILWSFATGGLIESSPAIGADGTIYVGSYDRRLYAIFPDGTERWSFPTGGRIFASPAIGADGTIYIGSGDQRLYAISPDGTRLWDFFTNGDIQASPVLAADGTIYVVADTSVYALRPGAVSGRLRWRAPISPPSGSISTPAVRADGTVIFGADDGIIRALSPDGTERWSRDTQVFDLIESSPIIAPDGSIYIGGPRYLFKLNGNGSPLSEQSSWPAFRRDARHTGRVRSVNTDGRLVNISTRAQAGGGRNLIAGFVVQSSSGRAFLVRAVGPGLQASNVGGFMPDPRLQLFAGSTPFHGNDNWLPTDAVYGLSLTETAAAVQAFPLQPGSADAAILPPLPGGVFTAHVTSADGRPGIALAEVYDGVAGDPQGRILNLSTRGFVGTDENILIAGFVVGGNAPMRLLLRGIGPGLTQFGVSGALARPRLTLFRGGTPIATNAGWTADGFRQDLIAAASSVSAFPLDEAGADCAMLFEAIPGAYTLQIAGVSGETGEAMVEIYVLP